MHQISNAFDRAMAFALEQQEKVEPTEKSSKLAEVISNMDSVCHEGKESIKEIVEILLGESIGPLEDNIQSIAKQGAIFINEQYNDDELVLGICYRLEGKFLALLEFGQDANGTLCDDEVKRWATPKEVEAYFDVVRGRALLGMEVHSDFPTRK